MCFYFPKLEEFANKVFAKIQKNNRTRYIALCDYLKSEYSIKVIDVIPEESKPFSKIYNKNKKVILIDYAHTKEAFENLLSNLPKDIDHKIIIFGCGGDRDKTKRTRMAKIASKYTDIQIITDDNPRNEKPSDIRRILIESSSNPLEIPSRKKAIEKGVKLLKTKKGLLIIAGKGHENIQIYKDKNFTFNDRLVAKSYAKYL